MDRVTLVMVVLIGFLLGAAGYIFFFTAPATGVMDNYQYGNGYTVFNVTKVSETETDIPMYVGGEEVLSILTFRNDPLSLEDIPVEGTLHTRIFNDEKIYITINPNANLTGKKTIAALEID